MTSKTRKGDATVAARLETCEQSARNLAAMFAECLPEDNAVSLVDHGHGRWMVAIHFPAAPDEAAVRALARAAAGDAAANALRFERVAAKDWVQESLSHLRPVDAGRFVVHGAHDRAAVAPNRIAIEIEAALAFGTGHHGTTRGCLLALGAICKALASASTPCWRRKRVRVLDLGTGSGVLAIAAARALRQRVLATDVDAQAVQVARANAVRNGVGTLIEAAHAAGVANGRICARAPFDLVFANILLAPLQRFAGALIKLVAPGGCVVLSGLLSAQEAAALSAYRPLRLERRVALDGWVTLVLRRGQNRRRGKRVAHLHGRMRN